MLSPPVDKTSQSAATKRRFLLQDRFCLAVVGLFLVGITGCSGGGASHHSACGQLRRPVVFSAQTATAFAHVVGRDPNLLDVLVGTWTPSDPAGVRVYLAPGHAAEVEELAQQFQQAGHTVVATLDQAEAYHEFSVLFAASPDLVGSVEAEDLPASVELAATATEEQARIAAIVKNDPRVKEVVFGQGSLSDGQFAAVVYAAADGDLDRLERMLPADRAHDVRRLRALSIQARAPAYISPADAREAAEAVSRLIDFAASECDLQPSRG